MIVLLIHRYAASLLPCEMRENQFLKSTVEPLAGGTSTLDRVLWARIQKKREKRSFGQRCRNPLFRARPFLCTKNWIPAESFGAL